MSVLPRYAAYGWLRVTVRVKVRVRVSVKVKG